MGMGGGVCGGYPVAVARAGRCKIHRGVLCGLLQYRRLSWHHVFMAYKVVPRFKVWWWCGCGGGGVGVSAISAFIF